MSRPASAPKSPLRWTAVLFALVANLLFVNLADRLVRSLSAPFVFEALATLVAPLLAGIATALYARQRGAMHAFLGGLISIPLLAWLTFGSWQLAILAGGFCGLGGALTEIFQRGRTNANEKP